jgi:hypothetical protein
MPTWGELFFDSSFIVPIQGLCPARTELASRGEAFPVEVSVFGNPVVGLPYFCELFETASKGTLFQPK